MGSSRFPGKPLAQLLGYTMHGACLPACCHEQVAQYDLYRHLR
ncbi:MAG: hypothetical protein P0107_00445 [Nitrosomonas sp.]|nr:hypothetical protein [Nitrosomonas sp.]